MFLFSSATTGWSQININADIIKSNNLSILPSNLSGNQISKSAAGYTDMSLQVQSFCYDSLSLVRISWAGPAGFESFDVYRNETLIATNIKSPYFVDSSVSPAAYYHYSISAKNKELTFSSSVSPDVFISPCASSSAAANSFQISVSPNPSPSVFYFTAANLRNKILSIEVLNSSGAKVYSQQTKSMTSDFIQTIDLSNAAPGTYFMKVKIDRNTYFKQIVKQ